MRKVLAALMVAGLAACGSGDDDTTTPAPNDDGAAAPADGGEPDEDADGVGGGGSITDAQPAGQAFAAVDGLEFTLQQPGGLDCTVSPEAITFSYSIGDNEITLGAGANFYEDQGWLGGINLRVANPESEDGPITYFPDLTAHGDRIVVDGASVSYSGPMMKQPANDGSNPPPVDVGDGTISITCP